MHFTIEETGEKFSHKFTDFSKEGSGIKVGGGFYTKSITATGSFMGEKPATLEIIESFEGSSKSVGVSVLWFGISGVEIENWIIQTGTLGISKTLPFSIGTEKIETSGKNE